MVMIHEWTEEKLVFDVYGTPVVLEGESVPDRIVVDEEEYLRESFESDEGEGDPWEQALK